MIGYRVLKLRHITYLGNVTSMRSCQSNAKNPTRDSVIKSADSLLDQGIVQVEYHSPSIVVVSLNDHKSKNTLGYEQVNKMTSIFDHLRDKKDLRVLILRSLVDNFFCAGANLKERARMTEYELDRWLLFQRELMDKIDNFPTPTIAAIEGFALGGGLEYALACDLRIMGQKARVGLPECKLGIIPGAGGTQRLSRLIGPAKAKMLIWTGKIIEGRQAYDMGIADELVEDTIQPGASFNKALELAQQISEQAPRALKLSKLAINKGLGMTLMNGLDFERSCYLQLLPTKDRLEGLRAFSEKRKPQYNGE